MESQYNLAYEIADRIISIQEVDGGYDYSIMNKNYVEIDGGVYDNPDVSIEQALNDIVEDLRNNPDYNGAKGNISSEHDLIPLDYDEVMEKAEMANKIGSDVLDSRFVMEFKAKTNERFHVIGNQDPESIEETVTAYVKSVLEEYEIEAEIIDLAINGSRARGIEKESSDLDVVVEFDTNEKEDFLFNLLNHYGLCIAGIKVDINPITRQESGTLEEYLIRADKYLERKELAMRESKKEIAINSGYELYNAVKFGKTELAKELIRAGADVNYVFEPEEYRLTPLHMAAYYAMDEIIELLIENGSEVNSCTIDGKTPLALAIERHNREQTVLLLMNHGAVDGTVPIPDYAKVGEVFLTSKNTYFLIADDGSIQEFQKSEFHKVLEMREKLNKLNEEVEITFRDKNQVRTNVYYGFSMPEDTNNTQKESNDEELRLAEQIQKRHIRHGR